MSKLTDSSRGKACIRCGAPDAYSCHYNGPRQHSFGKGRGIKAHDLMTAEFCRRCDGVFTEGSTAESVLRDFGDVVCWRDKWDRSEDFLFWIAMTNIRRMNDGVLKVG